MDSSDSPSLPHSGRAAEDAFVLALQDQDEDELIAGLVSAALQARRPQLAARLVGLLEGRVEIPVGSALDRARRAAGFLLVAPSEPEPSWVEELDEAWQLARQARMVRTKARMRQRASDPGTTLFGDTADPRRRPRLTGRNRRG